MKWINDPKPARSTIGTDKFCLIVFCNGYVEPCNIYGLPGPECSANHLGPVPMYSISGVK